MRGLQGYMESEKRTEIAGIRIQRPSEVAQESGAMITIAGPPDVGKTTMASYAQDSPYGAPVAFIDCEAGVRSIVHRDDIGILECKTWSEVDKLVTAFKRRCEFKTLILDNISELLEMCLDSLTTGIPTFSEHYKPATSMMIDLVHRLKAVARLHGTNIIILGWVDDIKVEGKVVRTTIALNPKTARRFAGTVDILGHMEFTKDFNTRVLNFQAGSSTDIRFRRSKLEPSRQVPLHIPHKESDRVICDLLAVMRGNEPWPTEKYTKQQPVKDN